MVPLLFSSASTKAAFMSASFGISATPPSVIKSRTSAENAAALSSGPSLPSSVLFLFSFTSRPHVSRNRILAASIGGSGVSFAFAASFSSLEGILAIFCLVGVALLTTFAFAATNFSGFPTPPLSSSTSNFPTGVSAFTSACFKYQHHSSNNTIPPPLSSMAEKTFFAAFLSARPSSATNPWSATALKDRSHSSSVMRRSLSELLLAPPLAIAPPSILLNASNMAPYTMTYVQKSLNSSLETKSSSVAFLVPSRMAPESALKSFASWNALTRHGRKYAWTSLPGVFSSFPFPLFGYIPSKRESTKVSNSAREHSPLRFGSALLNASWSRARCGGDAASGLADVSQRGAKQLSSRK
mmetsp:Transcript_8505/g.16387  ORF Transcript_8505/g.16387 Transcript_8505/m.16387 type:complete len:355 (-) Transcript_8505:873-1937(-)